MSCTRCQGLLLRDDLPGYGRWWWKCVLCGDRVDQVILRHRAAQEAEITEHRAEQERGLQAWARVFSAQSGA